MRDFHDYMKSPNCLTFRIFCNGVRDLCGAAGRVLPAIEEARTARANGKLNTHFDHLRTVCAPTIAFVLKFASFEIMLETGVLTQNFVVRLISGPVSCRTGATAFPRHETQTDSVDSKEPRLFLAERVCADR